MREVYSNHDLLRNSRLREHQYITMPRIARIIVDGLAYHITQRGNGRQQIFFTDAGYGLYWDLLRSNAKRAGLEVWG